MLFIIHHVIRGFVAKWVAKSLPEKELSGSVRSGFLRNTCWWQPLWRPFVVGWNKPAREKLVKIREASDRFVQTLNDEYTNPSGQN